MRRLLRWTFNSLTVASLLLCLATAGLWVRSYWVGDLFTAQRIRPPEERRWEDVPSYRWSTASYHGRFGGWLFQAQRPLVNRQTLRWEFELAHPDEHPALVWTTSPFRVLVAGSYTIQYWSLPDWPLVAAFAVLPAIFVFRQVRAVRRRRYRSRLGLCPACGYDLRASPERCPECGREGG